MSELALSGRCQLAEYLLSHIFHKHLPRLRPWLRPGPDDSFIVTVYCLCGSHAYYGHLPRETRENRRLHRFAAAIISGRCRRRLRDWVLDFCGLKQLDSRRSAAWPGGPLHVITITTTNIKSTKIHHTHGQRSPKFVGRCY